MALEEDGLPTVAVHTQQFARLCRSTALSMGMPRLRQAYTPHPVVDRSPAHLRAYIDGSDPTSKRPFMQEVLEGLTAPLEDADLQGLTFERAIIDAAGRAGGDGRDQAKLREDALGCLLASIAAAPPLLKAGKFSAGTLAPRLPPLPGPPSPSRLSP